MRKKIHIVFLVLSLVSLTYISYDYTYGHAGENPTLPNHCVICQAYQSTEAAQVFLAFILIFGILPIIGVISPDKCFSYVSTNLVVISLRAPPAEIA